MQVLEFVVQGLKHFPEQKRFTLSKGLNAFVDAQDGSPRAAILADALRGMLTYDPRKSYASRVMDPSAAIVRVGATLKGTDGLTYRLIHDLKTGTYALHVMKAEGAPFEPVSGQATEVAQFLRTQLGMPPEESFQKVLAASGRDLPSKRMAAPVMPGMMPGMAAMPGMPGMPGMMPGMAGVSGAALAPVPTATPGVHASGAQLPPVGGGTALRKQLTFGHLTPAERQARLEQSKKAVEALKKQQELEFELDGLQRRRFELDEQLKPVRAAEASVAEATAAGAQFADLARVPKDMLKQLDTFARQKAALAEEFRKADDNADPTGEMERALPPPWQDKVFQGGLGASVLSLLVGFGGAAALDMPGIRYVGFLNLVGLAAVALSLLKHVDRLEGQDNIQGLTNLAQERKDKAQRRFDLDTSSTRRILAECGVKDDAQLEAFKDRLVAREGHEVSLSQRQQALEGARAAGGNGGEQAEYDTLATRQAELEARLQGASFTGNEKDLLEEIRVLQAELGLPQDAPVLQPAAPGQPGPMLGADDDDGGYPPLGGSGGGGLGTAGEDARPALGEPGEGVPMLCASGEPGGGGGGGGAPGGPMMFAGFPGMMSGPPDAIIQLMKASLDLFHIPMEQLGTKLQVRTAQYLGALSDKRFTNVSFTDKGDVAAVDAQGKISAFATMGAQDQDLVWMSVLLTAAESYVKKRPVVLLVDGWFGPIPDVKHPLLAKMLQYLGTLTQVVHFCGRPSLAEGAETTLTL